MQIDSTKPHYEIRVRDSDPETGIVFRDKTIAVTTKEESAIDICKSMNHTNQDSHRDYYILSRNKMHV
jgi:hypothetical protein